MDPHNTETHDESGQIDLLEQVIAGLDDGSQASITTALEDAHPAEVASLIESLPPEQRSELWEAVPVDQEQVRDVLVLRFYKYCLWKTW